MDTELHRRIKARCRISRRGELHWILTGGAVIRIPELGNETYTTKRACYAAFVGPVEACDEVFSCCGVPQCIKPSHIALRAAKTPARALALPEHVESLSKPDVFRKPEPAAIFPKDMTLQKFHLVRFFSQQGNSLAQIRDAVGLPIVDIVKIKNGVYDQAARNLRGATRRAKAMKDARKTMGSPDVIEMEQPTFVGPGVPIEPEELTEEEKNWLRTVGRG